MWDTSSIVGNESNTIYNIITHGQIVILKQLHNTINIILYSIENRKVCTNNIYYTTLY